MFTITQKRKRLQDEAATRSLKIYKEEKGRIYGMFLEHTEGKTK
jgi:hypothetical protein